MWQKTVVLPTGALTLALARVGELDPAYPLTAAEAEVLATYRHPAKRRQWLTARALLANVLALPPTAAILNHPGGKPYVTDRATPVSLSHTHGYVAVATGPGPTVGVDVEAYRPGRDYAVRRLFMTAAELAAYQACPTEVLFLVVWSAKEALYKALHTHDGEISFHHNLRLDPQGLLRLPTRLPAEGLLETQVTAHLTDLPGRPSHVPVGVVLGPDYVVTYLMV
ncbi:MAG: 4'-phosphopantetheinyl transferase superfamily protein [Bacteroidia bacterium]|nr:4'-phosphopantetheinyl transferase superfamily protein [Bacteroidia bacterium]